MHDKGAAPRCSYGFHKPVQKFLAVVAIDAQTGFYRDRQRRCFMHGRDTIGHPRRFGHETGPHAAGTDPGAGTADIQIDFVKTMRLRKPCRLCQNLRLVPTHL